MAELSVQNSHPPIHSSPSQNTPHQGSLSGRVYSDDTNSPTPCEQLARDCSNSTLETKQSSSLTSNITGRAIKYIDKSSQNELSESVGKLHPFDIADKTIEKRSSTLGWIVEQIVNFFNSIFRPSNLPENKMQQAFCELFDELTGCFYGTPGEAEVLQDMFKQGLLNSLNEKALANHLSNSERLDFFREHLETFRANNPGDIVLINALSQVVDSFEQALSIHRENPTGGIPAFKETFNNCLEARPENLQATLAKVTAENGKPAAVEKFLEIKHRLPIEYQEQFSFELTKNPDSGELGYALSVKDVCVAKASLNEGEAKAAQAAKIADSVKENLVRYGEVLKPSDFQEANLQCMIDDEQKRDGLRAILNDPTYSRQNFRGIREPGEDSSVFYAQFNGKELEFSNRFASNGELRSTRLKDMLTNSDYENIGQIASRGHLTENDSMLIYLATPVKGRETSYFPGVDSESYGVILQDLQPELAKIKIGNTTLDRALKIEPQPRD